jgi:serine/threonine protein kinase
VSVAAGTRLGPYEIQSAIGAGGMGEVYKARDTRLDRTVAIKILPDTLATDPQFRERFDREARTISQLDHPHICALYDIGEQDGTSFLVMQYLEGETLEARFKKGALSLDQALQYAIQIADALATAHKAGIVHRDLKPGNIMLTKAGAKLLDFGLAKDSGSIAAGAGLSMLPTTPPNLTAQGTILGTFQYMAPEQLEGHEADARSDIFAFGAVAYEMVTGKKAFEGKSQASVAAAILERDPPSMCSLKPVTPPLLERTVKRCLAKEPEKRWQATSDLCDELKWIAEGGETGSSTVVRPTKVRERLAWGVALLAVLSAVLLGLRNSRVVTAPPETVRLSVVTPDTSSPLDFAISPDGRTLAFVAYAEGGKQLLWVRPLDSTTAQPLAGTEEATQPFWSPDNRFIAFFAGGKLKKIEVSGGTPQTICDVATPRGGTWNRDDVILLTRGANSGLSRVSAAGGEPTPLTVLDAKKESSHRYPQFLPDGRHFLFFVQAGRGNGISVGSIDAKESKHLLDTNMAALYAPPGYLLFVRDGVVMEQAFDAGKIELTGEAVRVVEGLTPDPFNRIAFSVSDTGVLVYRSSPVKGSRQFAWFDRSGKPLGPVGPGGEYFNPELSPNGKEVAFSQTDLQTNNLDIWRMDLTNGERRRLTFDPAIDVNQIWSPDGSRILFGSNRDGPLDVYQRLSSGAGTEERWLQIPGSTVVPKDWSVDGRFVILTVPDLNSRNQVWVRPLFGDRKPKAFVETAATNDYARFSPDGKWIAYASNESQKFEVYVQTFPTGNGKWQVSTNGGVQPRWRRDGKELFYLASDRKLMAVPVRSGSSFEFGVPVPLFATKTVGGSAFSSGYSHQYDVTPDGQRFLLNTEADGSATPITVVLNWTAPLKK